MFKPSSQRPSPSQDARPAVLTGVWGAAWSRERHIWPEKESVISSQGGIGVLKVVAWNTTSSTIFLLFYLLSLCLPLSLLIRMVHTDPLERLCHRLGVGSRSSVDNSIMYLCSE